MVLDLMLEVVLLELVVQVLTVVIKRWRWLLTVNEGVPTVA